MSVLQANRKIYLALLYIFNHTKDESLKLELAKLIGFIAYKFHSGYFREKKIEDFLRSFAKKNLQLNFEETIDKSKKNIVHVLTTLYETGGHTRLVENLIRLDKSHTHHIYVTDQGKSKIPNELKNYVTARNGLFVVDNNVGDLSKCKSLLNFAGQHAGKIFLHIHPYDIIPSLAFNTNKDLFDIFFINHADHAFSYGLDISSFLVNIREEAHNISINKREFLNSTVLPLPLRKVQMDTSLRNSLRNKYGITENEVLGVCIGSAYKFKSNKFYDFFKTMNEILTVNTNLKIIVIGLDYNLAKKNDIEITKHPRMFLKGVVEEPFEYQMMADIAIDPMPFGSYTALLETSYYGAYPLVCYNTNPLFDLSRDPALNNYVKMSKSESDYKNHFNFLCSNPQFLSEHRKIIYESIKSWHSGEKCLAIFSDILEKRNFHKTDEVLPDSDFYDEEFANLNPNLIQQKKIILSFFYSHSEQFSVFEITRIVSTLMRLKFNYRDLLAILKKNLSNQIFQKTES